MFEFIFIYINCEWAWSHLNNKSTVTFGSRNATLTVKKLTTRTEAAREGEGKSAIKSGDMWVGCDKDGRKIAPQCQCTKLGLARQGPWILPFQRAFFFFFFFFFLDKASLLGTESWRQIKVLIHVAFWPCGLEGPFESHAIGSVSVSDVLADTRYSRNWQVKARGRSTYSILPLLESYVPTWPVVQSYHCSRVTFPRDLWFSLTTARELPSLVTYGSTLPLLESYHPLWPMVQPDRCSRVTIPCDLWFNLTAARELPSLVTVIWQSRTCQMTEFCLWNKIDPKQFKEPYLFRFLKSVH